MTAEAKVRASWEFVQESATGGLWIIAYSTKDGPVYWLDISCPTPEEKWTAALAFTEAHRDTLTRGWRGGK